MISGPSWRFGLLGTHIAHTLSPALHQAAFQALGIEGHYDVLDLPERDVLDAVTALRDGRYHGLNVTTPFKQVIVDDTISLVGAAQLLGAVNTLVPLPNGTIEGHNTDVKGMQLALLSRAVPEIFRGIHVLLVGAGGAARAALLALDELGVARIDVYNRSIEHGQQMVAELRPVIRAELHTPKRLEYPVDLVVQATSIGSGWSTSSSAWGDALSDARDHLNVWNPRLGVFDLVYRPAPTPWTEAAKSLELAAVDGREMLVRQAALSFELWTKRTAPLEVMRSAVYGTR